MLLTVEEVNRLDRLFARLWYVQDGVKGSWSAQAYNCKRTYIHRGGLLLRGSNHFVGLTVLVPADARVIPIYGDPNYTHDPAPAIDGEAVRVFLDDDGPWWDAVRSEIPLMEAEVTAYSAGWDAKRDAKQSVRAAELQRAAASLASAKS